MYRQYLCKNVLYVYDEIFDCSEAIVPTCFKRSTIIPVLKHNKPSSLNDYCPVAITSLVMKMIEQLVKDIPPSRTPSTHYSPNCVQHHHPQHWSPKGCVLHFKKLAFKNKNRSIQGLFACN